MNFNKIGFSRSFGAITILQVANKPIDERIAQSFKPPFGFETEADSFYMVQPTVSRQAPNEAFTQSIKLIECPMQLQSPFELLFKYLSMYHFKDPKPISYQMLVDAEARIFSDFMSRPVKMYRQQPNILTSVSALLGSNSMSFSNKRILELKYHKPEESSSYHVVDIKSVIFENSDKILAFNHINGAQTRFVQSDIETIELTIKERFGPNKHLFSYYFDESAVSQYESSESIRRISPNNLIFDSNQHDMKTSIYTNSKPVELKATDDVVDTSKYIVDWIKVGASEFISQSIIDSPPEGSLQPIQDEQVLGKSNIRDVCETKKWQNQVYYGLLSNTYRTVRRPEFNGEYVVLINEDGKPWKHAIHGWTNSDNDAAKLKKMVKLTDMLSGRVSRTVSTSRRPDMARIFITSSLPKKEPIGLAIKKDAEDVQACFLK